MKTLLILFTTLCCFSIANGQLISKLGDDDVYIQSMETQFLSGANDSLKADAALRLSAVYKRELDMEKSKYYLDYGLSQAKGNAFLEAVAPYYQAFYGFGVDDLAATEKQVALADSLLQKYTAREAYRIRANTWILQGVLAQLRAAEEKALDAYLNHALPFAEKSADSFLIGNVHKFIGIIFMNSNDRDKAIGYLNKALQAFDAAPEDGYPNKLTAIAETTIHLAENYLHTWQLDKAKIPLERAKEILKPYPNSNLYLYYYYAEGVYYDHTKQYEKALQSFNKGIALVGGSMENYQANRMRYGKFETLFNMKSFAAAIQTMQELQEKAAFFPLDRRVYLKKLSEANAQTGNIQEAYKLAREYITFSDSLHKENYESKLVELEKKYESAEKEAEILRLEADNQTKSYQANTARLYTILSAIGCLLFLCVATFLFYVLRNSRRLAAQKEVAHQQLLADMKQKQELKMTQAMLEGEEKERRRIARDLHDGLGGALSGIKIKLSGQRKIEQEPVVEEVIHQLENSIAELRRIARNMMPESLVRSGLEVALRDLCVSLTGNGMDIELQTDGIRRGLSVVVQTNIYRIVQELLTNAVRHSEATKVIVQCLQDTDRFFITVEDNGKGLDLSKTQPSGMGMDNVRNRVAFLNGHIEVDAAPDEGVTVNVELLI